MLGASLALAVAALVSLTSADFAAAASHGPATQEALAGAAPALAQSARGPAANLPYLFAVFFVAWAAFFGYAFFMSRRQKEIETEIVALRAAVAERQREEAKGG